MSSWCGATGARSPQILQEADEELDLPPLDGAVDDEDHPAASHGDDESLDEGEALGDDDRAASELDADVELDVTDEAPIEGGEAARDAIDTGGAAEEIAFFDEAARGSDESGPAGEEDEESPFDASMNGEDGAGTSDDLSSFVDEGALPPLDADGGEGEGLEPSEPVAASRVALAVERNRWGVATGMGAQVPCWLVAVSPVHVVAAGPTVVIARDGARVSKPAGPEIDVVALATAEEAIFAVARKGTLFASVDGGDTWATGSVPWTAVRGTLAIAATPGRLWVCEGGALWSVRWSRKSRPEPPIQARKDGVRAMTTAGSTLVILTEKVVFVDALVGSDAGEQAPEQTELAIEKLRGDDEAPDVQVVPAAVGEAIGEGPVTLAATPDGRAIGLLANGGVLVSRDGGASFRRCKVAGHAIALAFAGQGEGARLLVLVAPEDRSRGGDLSLQEVGESASSRVAELPGAGAASGRAALVWDATREVLWVASSSGLVAYEPAARH